MGEESTLTSKGQTTIPKGIRDKLAMKSGDRMTFTLMPDGNSRSRADCSDTRRPQAIPS